LWGALEQEINNPSPVASDLFGNSVSINSTGDRVIIGALNEATGAAGAGSAYIYEMEDTSVTGNIYVPPQRLTNDNTNNFLKVV
jgi:hypothetical protein